MGVIVHNDSIFKCPRLSLIGVATKVFLQKGVKAAAELLDRPDMDTNLKSATLDQLSRAVATKARSVELEELRRYQNDSDCQTSQYVDDALDALSYLLSQIRKED